MKMFGFAVVACACLASTTSAQPRQAGAQSISGQPLPRTQWGAPDLRGTWPLQNINDARIRLERPTEFGARERLTDEEFAARVQAAEQSDARFSVDWGGGGTAGLAAWLRSSSMGRRSSLLIEPLDGRLPPLTEAAKEAYTRGRSTWRAADATDWVTDLDAFERCITRGFPAVMLPQPYNNGIRVFQSPGYIVLQLETFGARVVPLGRDGGWPAPVRAWHGDSRGRWEGDTLVIETSNLKGGDSVTTDASGRAAGPVPGRELATLPVGPSAKVTEWIARTGPDTISYRVRYEDADVFTSPWTAAFEWSRDDSYAADSEFAGQLVRTIPLGRYGTVEEIAGAVSFLAGPDASYITGTTLYIDGGATA